MTQAAIPYVVSAHQLRSAIRGWLPGCAFYARNGHGAEYAEASFGWACAPWDGPAEPWTPDSIAHLGSVSKCFTAAGIMALIEDWNWLHTGLAALAPIRYTPVTLPLMPTYAVPEVLSPAFQDPAMAQQLVALGVPARLPSGWGDALTHYAGSGQRGNVVLHAALPPPVAYTGMMDRVLRIGSALDLDACFLFLVEDKLLAGAQGLGISFRPGANVGPAYHPSWPVDLHTPGLTLRQLLTHQTTLRQGVDASRFPGGQAQLDRLVSEPSGGGPAVFDWWPYFAVFLGQDADGSAGYNNQNYRVLGAVLAACTGMDYTTWMRQRIFFDNRFSHIQRMGSADPATAVLYYPAPTTDSSGRPHELGPGQKMPDYTAWTGDGGWYGSARQVTDWAFALYTRQAVAQPNGLQPLLSQASVDALFSVDHAFSGGDQTSFPGIGGTTVLGYLKNGGLDKFGGSHCVVGVLVGPGSGIHVAFINTNASFMSAPLPASAPASVDNIFGNVLYQLALLF